MLWKKTIGVVCAYTLDFHDPDVMVSNPAKILGG